MAEAPDGAGVALQCKKAARFGPADISAAVEAFRSTDRPFSVGRFIIAVSREVRSTQAVDRLQKLQRDLAPIELLLWDKRELSVMLRAAPGIVVEYFGNAVAERFCQPFAVGTRVVPTQDAAEVRESIARTPEVTTGAEGLIAQANDLAAEEPSDALKLVSDAQARLVHAGFSGHAAQYERLRASLEVATDLGKEATRRRLDHFWEALGRGQTTDASIASSDIGDLAEQIGMQESSNHALVANRALSLYENPLAYVPSLSGLLVGEPADCARLAALAGEVALADGNLDWLAAHSVALEDLGESVRESSEDGSTLCVRLRVLAAEGSGNWGPLLEDARRLRLGYSLVGLVNARHARYLAGDQKFHEAEIAWDEATGAACLAQRWTDAARWTFSRRVFRTRWRPFETEELLPVQTSLLARGPVSTVLPRDEYAMENALRLLSTEKLRPAAIAAQRALRDAVTLSDWAGESNARKVLADVLEASGEAQEAARHTVLAGDSSGAKRLVGRVGDQYLEVVDQLVDEPYWVVGAAYRIIAGQADIVPDSDVDQIVDLAIRDLDAVQSGELIDLAGLAGSRLLGAIAVIAGLADRLDMPRADRILSFFESQSEVAADHYRYHDDDEALTSARISRGHIGLRERALRHLIGILARSYTSRKPETIDVVAGQFDTAQPQLEALGLAGNTWALDFIASQAPDGVGSADVEEARLRLEAPLQLTPGVTTVGSGGRSVTDSILVRELTPAQQEASLRQLLERARNVHVSSSDRSSYLLAASNLKVPRGSVRRDLFAQALSLVVSPPSYDTDASEESFAHPLGAFTITGATDSRAEAAFLAAALASTKREREAVRSAALTLLGDDRASESWTARAIQRLGDPSGPEVGFLSGQHWALRSVASIQWAKTADPEAVGDRLASDPDARVRRLLGSEVLARYTLVASGSAEEDVIKSEGRRRQRARSRVISILQADPRFSVRRAVTSD